MLSKQHLAAGMIRECEICQHLFTKLSKQSFSYRPAVGQRSTVELLRYLAICGISGLRCLAENNWKLFTDYANRVKDLRAEDFPDAMDEQKQEIADFFEKVSEQTLETQPAMHPAAGMLPLGVAILEGPYKWLTSYKLQLFLYAKATGANDIGTSNAWAGKDRRP